jgi:succinate dehydrogenase hydrophobic anchor subunit
MTGKRAILSLTRRGLNFEMAMWAFTRLSALAMYGLVLLGLVGALIMGARTQMNFADVMRWAFTPNVTHVQNTNLQDIAPWASAFWKVVASAMVLVASAHGVHGLVVIADDYVVSARGRAIARVLSIIVLLCMSVIGVYVIWTS